MSEAGAIVIRPAAPADTAAIGALVVGIQQGEFGGAITLADQPDLTDIDGFYRSGAGEFWVADGNGRIVGTLALKDLGAGTGALRKMFVDAAWRGPAHGVARRLLQTLLAHARAHGLDTIVLGTTDWFRAAHRFYERSGFARIEREDLPANFPFMGRDTRFYRLRL